MQHLVGEQSTAELEHGVVFSEVSAGIADTCKHLAPYENQAYGVLHLT